MKKNRIKLLLLICTLFISNLSSQNTVGVINISEGVSSGYTLFSSYKKSYLINNCGQIINEWQSEYTPGNAVYLLPNGNLLRTGKDDGKSNITFGGQGGIVELFNWEGVVIWSYSFNNNSIRQHHDVYPMPNGNILVLIAESWNIDSVIANGRNPVKVTGERLYNEKIIEIKPIGSNDYELVWEWSVKDHLVQDFDSNKANFGVVSENPQKLDINFLNGLNGAESWLHVNSIQYNSKLDQIIIGSRNLSEFWIIDHSTTIAESQSSSGGKYGKGGDFLYRWGNPQSYKLGTENDRVLYGQHSPNFIVEQGIFTDNVIVFNNGRDRTPLFSEVLKLKLPVDSNGFYSYTPNKTYLPTNAFYNYKDLSQTPSEFYSGILSSAQVLPNNNILICEGASGNLFEINENEEVVWQYIIPSNNSSGVIYNQNESPGGNTTFRAKKYPLDFPAFDGKVLSGTTTIEAGTDVSVCTALAVEKFNDFELTIYPNPTKNGEIFIKSVIDISKLEIFDVTGKMVLKVNKFYQSTINISKLNKGIYFGKFYSSKGFSVKKIIYN